GLGSREWPRGAQDGGGVHGADPLTDNGRGDAADGRPRVGREAVREAAGTEGAIHVRLRGRRCASTGAAAKRPGVFAEAVHAQFAGVEGATTPRWVRRVPGGTGILACARDKSTGKNSCATKTKTGHHSHLPDQLTTRSR